MPRPRPEIVRVVVITNVSLVTTAETEILEIPGISTTDPDERVTIIAILQLTTGTATTTVTPRVRRGATTAGTLVGEENAINVGAAAGSTEQFFAFASESPGAVASQPYIVSLEQAAATANGTVLYAIGIAIVG